MTRFRARDCSKTRIEGMEVYLILLCCVSVGKCRAYDRPSKKWYYFSISILQSCNMSAEVTVPTIYVNFSGLGMGRSK
jgi:hypothetical protein